MTDAGRSEDDRAATDGGASDAAMTEPRGVGDAAPTGAPGADDVLSVRDLSTRFFTEEGQINAVESVSFDLREDEILGVVGESGSGKSVTALSLVDLVETPGRITAGEVWYRDPDLAEEFRGTEAVRVDGDHVDLRTVPPGVRRSLRGPSASTPRSRSASRSPRRSRSSVGRGRTPARRARGRRGTGW
jgi:peptide/nickel transport system ATP-binding protein